MNKKSDEQFTKRKKFLVFVLLVFIVSVVLFGRWGLWLREKLSARMVDSASSPKQPQQAPLPSTVDLNAYVKFIGWQVVIKNRDDFDWKNVKLEINSGFFKSAFTKKVPLVLQGQTYTVGAAEFAKPDGTRFNPFTTKCQDFTIWCDISGGRRGLYVGTSN